jgi:hypothetical protein
MADKFKPVKRSRGGMEVSTRGYLPSISFDEKQLPEIRKWEVGQTYEIGLKVKQVSLSEEDGSPLNARFEIHGVKVTGGKRHNPKVMESFRKGTLRNSKGGLVKNMGEAMKMAEY